jgi:hypothetical protein
VPGKRIALRITHDSKNRLTSYFDRLDWVVEVAPGSSGHALLKAEASAHTSHWRARLFGRIADQILMNQVYYPDVFKLARLNETPDQSLPPID